MPSQFELLLVDSHIAVTGRRRAYGHVKVKGGGGGSVKEIGSGGEGGRERK